jgi:hypothetical protein
MAINQKDNIHRFKCPIVAMILSTCPGSHYWKANICLNELNIILVLAHIAFLLSVNIFEEMITQFPQSCILLVVCTYRFSEIVRPIRKKCILVSGYGARHPVFPLPICRHQPRRHLEYSSSPLRHP